MAKVDGGHLGHNYIGHNYSVCVGQSARRPSRRPIPIKASSHQTNQPTKSIKTPTNRAIRPPSQDLANTIQFTWSQFKITPKQTNTHKHTLTHTHMALQQCLDVSKRHLNHDVSDFSHSFLLACSCKYLSKPPSGAVPCMSLPPLCRRTRHTTSM